MKLYSLLLIAMFLPAPACADLWLPSVFSNSMVLQSGKSVAVWGEAKAGAEVTVEFGGQVKRTVADTSKYWKIILDPMVVSSKPRKLTISSNANNATIQYSNVLVGEVWILAGQSNMGWPLSGCDGGGEAALKADYPWLRIFKQWPYQGAADKPAKDVTGGQWVTCDPQQAAGLSGVGFFFARKLQELLPADTPIALVNTQMGATYAECWIERETLENTPSAKPFLDKAAREIKPGEFDPKGYWGVDNFRRPAAMFNGKVAPLQPMAARGVIWYQGEGNSQKWLADGYAGTLTALINSWRGGFEQPELSFLIVQLPRYKAGPGNDWPAIRAAQEQVAKAMAGVEMIVTIDCGSDDQIHPPDKQPVGERLAWLAAEKVYGAKMKPSNSSDKAKKRIEERN